MINVNNCQVQNSFQVAELQPQGVATNLLDFCKFQLGVA